MYVRLFASQVDDRQPLEYLSEMRQVSILFINLVTEDTTRVEGCVLLQQCFDLIFAQLKKMGGKSLLFFTDNRDSGNLK